MQFSKLNRTVSAFSMAFLISNIPQTAVAETVIPTMIPTTAVLQSISDQEAKDSVSTFMSRSDVKTLLLERGLSSTEVEQRLAALSPDELKAFSAQIEEARAGGDILVAILLVVLIIYFFKRI